VMAFNWSSHGGDVGFYWLLHLKEKKKILHALLCTLFLHLLPISSDANTIHGG